MSARCEDCGCAHGQKASPLYHELSERMRKADPVDGLAALTTVLIETALIGGVTRGDLVEAVSNAYAFAARFLEERGVEVPK